MVKKLPVVFQNCRNIVQIDGGELPLQYNRLNVLFGSNGTGKTTISRVLDCWNDPTDSERLEGLESFRYQMTRDSGDAPNVVLPSSRARRVLTFNSEWVDDHCFQSDGNLQLGAYELYVTSPEVRRLERDRRKLLSKLDAVLADEETESIRAMAEAVSKGLGTTSRGKVGSAFKDGSPLEGLPKSIKHVATGMHYQSRPGWMSWHVQGAPYANELGDACPYCGQKVRGLEEVLSFDALHAAKQGEAWDSAVSVFAKGELFRPTVNQKALRLMGGLKKPDDEETKWIVGRAKRAKSLAVSIADARTTVRSFGGNSTERFFSELRTHLAIMEDATGFSDRVRSTMKSVASAMRSVVANEEKIQGLVHRLEAQAADNVLKYKREMNELLKKCGYPYTIEIRNNCADRESRVVLTPRDAAVSLDGRLRRTLSYGEQNTLALLLFMFEALEERDSTIIVIDDPISSFDGDKRFTLLYRMFRKNKGINAEDARKSLAGRTVVLLTHDYLVVSDLLVIMRTETVPPNVLHVTCEEGGILTYRVVSRDAMRPYIQMIRKRIKDSKSRDPFFQLVYIRCYCEMMRRSKRDKRTSEGCAFQVISTLVDGDDWPKVLKSLKWDGSESESYVLRTGVRFIRQFMPDFDFKETFTKLRDDSELRRLYQSAGITPYEKLQVLRLLLRQSKAQEESPIMVRYANEVYHLAGDYLLQLDPVDFNPVPPFVQAWCDSLFDEFAGEGALVEGLSEEEC